MSGTEVVAGSEARELSLIDEVGRGLREQEGSMSGGMDGENRC